MELNTLEDVQKAFPDEESARKYFHELRWGKFAKCPFCGNEKCYFIENSKRLKCANKECHKKISVTSKTILEASNIKLHVWFGMMFMFARSRGRYYSHEVCDVFKIAPKNEFFVRERIEFAWKHVNRENKNSKEIFDDLLGCIIEYYPQFHEHKHSPYYSNPFHIDVIDDISDQRQFNLLLRYTRYYVDVYCHWIWIDFATPGDILSEAFLWMSEKGIKEYNGESVIKIIQQTINRMWVNYLNNSPKYNEWMKKYRKKSKEDQVINMKSSYIVGLIRSSKEGKEISTNDIRKDLPLMNKKRKELLEKRKQLNRNYDFISHFS